MTRSNQRGFTIIELLIATVIFSVILLVITGAIVQFNKIYYRGVVVNRTNDRARSIVEEIAKDIQMSRAGTVSASANTYCVGDRRYTYNLNTFTRSTPPVQRALIVDTPAGGCSPTAPLAADARELIGEDMRLQSFVLTSQPNGTVSISVHLTYGRQDADFTDATRTACRGIGFGGQFCAVSQITTTVTPRLNND